jgi:hypothetical protein
MPLDVTDTVSQKIKANCIELCGPTDTVSPSAATVIGRSAALNITMSCRGVQQTSNRAYPMITLMKPTARIDLTCDYAVFLAYPAYWPTNPAFLQI